MLWLINIQCDFIMLLRERKHPPLFNHSSCILWRMILVFRINSHCWEKKLECTDSQRIFVKDVVINSKARGETWKGKRILAFQIYTFKCVPRILKSFDEIISSLLCHYARPLCTFVILSFLRKMHQVLHYLAFL